MNFDFYNNFLFRSGDNSDSVVNYTFNVNYTNSTFYSPLTTNNGLTNNNAAITNNSTLTQVGASSFTGAITCNGIACSGITNISYLQQVRTSAFTGMVTTAAGIINQNNFYMPANGGASIYFTKDGTTTNNTNNTFVRLLGSNNQMVFGFIKVFYYVKVI